MKIIVEGYVCNFRPYNVVVTLALYMLGIAATGDQIALKVYSIEMNVLKL